MTLKESKTLKVMKFYMKLTKVILDLKYFDLKDNKLILTDQTLFTEKEIFFMLDSKKDGTDLWWNN